jgi:hypothetical protein
LTARACFTASPQALGMDAVRFFRWTRNLFALLGLAGCALVLLVAGLAFRPRQASTAHARPAKPTLEEADWLIDNAGLLRQRASLRLVDSGRHATGNRDDEGDGGGMVDAWCLRGAVTVAADVHWMAAASLDGVLGEGLERALAAGHAQADCIPEAADVRARFLRVLPLRIELYHGQPQSASVALLDRDRGELYLVNATLLPPPSR